MERQKKIVDASVLVKGFSEEIDSNKTHQLIKDHLKGEISIVIPELTFLEVTNALKYKKRDEEALKKVSEDLFGFQFKVEKVTKSILDKAIENSLKYNITMYDSTYIALAQIHNCQLITADKELYKIPNVVPLEKI